MRGQPIRGNSIPTLPSPTSGIASMASVSTSDIVSHGAWRMSFYNLHAGSQYQCREAPSWSKTRYATICSVIHTSGHHGDKIRPQCTREAVATNAFLVSTYRAHSLRTCLHSMQMGMAQSRFRPTKHLEVHQLTHHSIRRFKPQTPSLPPSMTKPPLTPKIPSQKSNLSPTSLLPTPRPSNSALSSPSTT